jgi:hypothetical protein
VDRTGSASCPMVVLVFSMLNLRVILTKKVDSIAHLISSSD